MDSFRTFRFSKQMSDDLQTIFDRTKSDNKAEALRKALAGFRSVLDSTASLIPPSLPAIPISPVGVVPAGLVMVRFLVSHELALKAGGVRRFSVGESVNLPVSLAEPLARRGVLEVLAQK